MFSRSSLSEGLSDAKLACHSVGEGFTGRYLGWLQFLEEPLERCRVDGTTWIAALLMPVPLQNTVLFFEGSRCECPCLISLFHLRRAESSQQSPGPGSFAQLWPGEGRQPPAEVLVSMGNEDVPAALEPLPLAFHRAKYLKVRIGKSLLAARLPRKVGHLSGGPQRRTYAADADDAGRDDGSECDGVHPTTLCGH